MKNLFKLGFAALAISLSVAACGGSNQTENSADSTAVDSAITDTTMLTDTTAIDTAATADTAATGL